MLLHLCMRLGHFRHNKSQSCISFPCILCTSCRTNSHGVTSKPYVNMYYVPRFQHARRWTLWSSQIICCSCRCARRRPWMTSVTVYVKVLPSSSHTCSGLQPLSADWRLKLRSMELPWKLKYHLRHMLMWHATWILPSKCVQTHTHTRTYTQHPLVSPLLAGLLSPSLPTAHACCSALVAAVTHSWVARHVSIAALVTHAATTKAYPLAVGAISELLLYEVKAVEAEYHCPYSLRCVCTFYFCTCAYTLYWIIDLSLVTYRTNTHPFISVLNARPESGQSIIREIAHMFTVADPK